MFISHCLQSSYFLFPLFLIFQNGMQIAGAFREFRVSGSEELHHVLDKALPGDQIFLAGGVYHGPFNISKNGSSEDFIQLGTFNRDKVQIVGNGTDPAINLRGSYWLVSDLSIFSNNSIGLLISGANNIVSNIKITKVDTAVQVTGLANIVENCYIFKAKTGIDLIGNGTMLVNNLFHEKNVTCVKMRRSSCCGRLIGNICLFGEDIDEGRDYVVIGGTSKQ